MMVDYEFPVPGVDPGEWSDRGRSLVDRSSRPLLCPNSPLRKGAGTDTRYIAAAEPSGICWRVCAASP